MGDRLATIDMGRKLGAVPVADLRQKALSATDQGCLRKGQPKRAQSARIEAPALCVLIILFSEMTLPDTSDCSTSASALEVL